MPKRQSESDMNNPEEFAAWAFAAGIPDPRGQQFPNQPLIPAPCFAMLSSMLWDLGFRHNPDLQTKWVADYAGPDRNLVALGLSDSPDTVMDRAVEMLADQFPDVAARVATVTPGNRDQVVAEQAEALRKSLDRLREAVGSDGA